jgi:hypothetical protein
LTKIAINLIRVTFSSPPGSAAVVIPIPQTRGGIDKIEFLTTSERKSNYHLAFSFQIRFDDFPAIASTAESLLRDLSNKVVKIVDEMEAIMRREGFPV